MQIILVNLNSLFLQVFDDKVSCGVMSARRFTGERRGTETSLSGEKDPEVRPKRPTNTRGKISIWLKQK